MRLIAILGIAICGFNSVDGFAVDLNPDVQIFPEGTFSEIFSDEEDFPEEDVQVLPDFEENYGFDLDSIEEEDDDPSKEELLKRAAHVEMHDVTPISFNQPFILFLRFGDIFNGTSGPKGPPVPVGLPGKQRAAGPSEHNCRSFEHIHYIKSRNKLASTAITDD